jgi:hypothetical protein
MADGQLVSIQVTPTITASSAYATGNALGGLLTLTNMGNFCFSSLRSVVVTDKANQKSAMDVLLFGRTFTATADKNAIAISSADLLNMVGSVNIATTDYVTVGTGAVATKVGATGGIWLPMPVSGGDNTFYAQLVARGTPTYASTSDISVRFVFELQVDMKGA